MEHILKAFYLVVGVVIVVIATTTMFYETNEVKSFLNAQDELFQETVLYENVKNNSKDITVVPYEEVVIQLLNEVEYPIKIKGTIYIPDSIQVDHIDYSDISSQKEYRKTYVFDTNGQIQQINYD